MKKNRSTGEKLMGHPQEGSIRELLISGWSPEKVAWWLEQRHPAEKVGASTIRAYRIHHLDPREVLPASVYEKFLKGINVTVDSLPELYNAIEVQKRRIGPLLALEKAGGVALKDTSREMRLLIDSLLSVLDKEMDLGIRTRKPIEIVPGTDIKAWLNRREDDATREAREKEDEEEKRLLEEHR